MRRFARAHDGSAPEPARSSLQVSLLLLRRAREPVRAAAPTGRIVVLAPHMDDEVFGCGGTLALAVAGGAAVTVVFMTNGGKGYNPLAVRGRSAAEIVAWGTALSERCKGGTRRGGQVLGSAHR